MVNVNDEFYKKGFNDGIKFMYNLYNSVIAEQMKELLETYNLGLENDEDG